MPHTPMIVLVTGARGMLGQRVVRTLAERNHRVRTFEGDVRNADNTMQQTAGCDAVVHLAAVLDENNARAMREVNVDGTRHILDACEKNRIKHLILASTAGVHAKENQIVSEQSAFSPETEYEKTKKDAELLAHDYFETIPLTILRPALVMGPNDYWKGIVRLVKKDFPIIGKGTNAFSTISSDDAARAIAHVLGDARAIGETYVVAGPDTPTLNDVVREIRRQLGRTQAPRHIPFFAGLMIAYASSGLSTLTRKKTLLLPSHVKRLVRNRAYDTSKIRSIGFVAADSLDASVTKLLIDLEEKKT